MLEAQALRPNRPAPECPWCSSTAGRGRRLSGSLHVNMLSFLLTCLLSIYVPVGLSVCLSVHLLVYVAICLSICLSINLSVYLCVCLFIYLSVYLSICLFI